MRYVLVALCFIWQMAIAESTTQLTDETSLSQQQQVWQMLRKAERMHALSKNYYHGTTVGRDLVQAHAWLALYVAVLPDSYPGMHALLKQLRAKLTEPELASSQKLMAFYREKYGLSFKLTEQQLNQAFHTSEFVDHDTQADTNETLPEFEQLIQQLQDQGQIVQANVLHDRMQQALATAQQYDKGQVVYGQIKIIGHPDPQLITSTVSLTQDGYFVAVLEKPKDSIPFHLNGYQPITIHGHRKQGLVMNAGVFTLVALAEQQRASFVGSLIGLQHPEQVNVVMRPLIKQPTQELAAEDPFWLQQAPVMVLKSGEFFAVGLTPGSYRIQVSANGEPIWQQVIQLKAGELRQLDAIQLPQLPTV